MIPVRCFTCGAPLGHLWEEFKKRISQGEEPSKVLDELGVKRYCCRRTLFTAITYIENISLYYTLRAKKFRSGRGVEG